MREIRVGFKVKKQIKEDLGVTYQTIRYALYGTTKSDKAKRIRKKALELGGVEVPTKK